MKCHDKILKNFSKVDKEMFQNLTRSRVYPRINLSDSLLHKGLITVMMTETGPEVYVETDTTVIYDSCKAL